MGQPGRRPAGELHRPQSRRSDEDRAHHHPILAVSRCHLGWKLAEGTNVQSRAGTHDRGHDNPDCGDSPGCVPLWTLLTVGVNAGDTRFVSMPNGFEGRIVRGVDATMLGGQPHLLPTWFEFSWDSNGWSWDGVSLIRDCDGAVLMLTTHGSFVGRGFTQWILDGAPGGADATNDDGQVVLMNTENTKQGGETRGLRGSLSRATSDI